MMVLAGDLDVVECKVGHVAEQRYALWPNNIYTLSV